MKIKVLLVTGGFRPGVTDGIASVLYNYGTSVPFQNSFQVDYLALGSQPFEQYREIIETSRSKLISLGIHSSGINRLLEILIRLFLFLKNRNYDIIHINSGVPSMVYMCCLASRLAKVRVIIAHSHNTYYSRAKRRIPNIFFKSRISIISDYLYACSETAAGSMFSERILRNHEWHFIPNAILASRFEFSKEERLRERAKLDLTGKHIIGHVGSFKEQKNHEYLIRVFAEIYKKDEDARLLLVGTGDREDYIRSFVQRMGVEKQVIFLGQRSDVNLLLNAMDVFILPSKWEGFPVVLVEAQANGLRCFVSDTITPEVVLSDLVSFFSLEENPARCAERIILYLMNRGNSDRHNRIRSSAFDINASAEMLAEKYKSYLINRS